MTIEDVLNETGGLGKFQVAVIACLFFNKFITGWSMLQMSYAGFTPSWHCLGLNDTSPENATLNTCNLKNNNTSISTRCETYQFTDQSWTIITEWNLVCDLKWVKATVTSLQMAGVLVGALVAGQMGDYLGRKRTTYLFVLEHGVANVVAAFSVTWVMFAVCRFLIGLGIGAILVVVFPYPMEFMPKKWRPILAATPVWALGTSAFALAAVLLDDWSHIHLACGVVALLGLLGYFFVPESMRWLTVHGRVQDAEKIVAQIAKFNNKPLPEKTSIVLKEAAEEEKRIRESGQKYTYIDVFRGWQTAKITLIFCYHWFVFSTVYYGISFGVSSLSGQVQLNIFLLAAVELPAVFSTYCFSNKFGRKWTSITFVSITVLSAFACLFVQLYGPKRIKGYVVTGLSLTAKMCTGAAWAAVQTWGTEIYPTVTRNLGYGAANTASRVGGIIAPFLIDFDNMLVVSYVVIGALSVVSVLLMMVTPETMGTELADSLTSISTKGDQSNIVTENTSENTGNNETAERQATKM